MAVAFAGRIVDITVLETIPPRLGLPLPASPDLLRLGVPSL